MRIIVKALLLALWAIAATAQTQIIDVANRHIIFDKLKSTVIEFVATSKPELTVEPDAKIPFTLHYQNGKGKVVFSSPFSEGNYTIKFGIPGTAQSTHCNLVVLPTRLDERSEKVLRNLKFSYGRRLMVQSRLLPEAELPLSQFFVEYQLGTEQPVEGAYSQRFIGPYIPASAKKVSVKIYWKYPATGEKVLISGKEVEPDQTPPDIVLGWGEDATYNPRDNSYLITLPSATVDYEVPVDADNTDPQNSKSVKSTVDMVEIVGKPEIDFTDPYNTVKVLRGALPLQSWSMMPETAEFSSDLREPGVVKLRLVLKNLPQDFSAIKGTVAIKIAARIINNKAGKSSQAMTTSILIPINILHKMDMVAEKPAAATSTASPIPAGSIKTPAGDVLIVKQNESVVQRMNGEYQHKYPERAKKTGSINVVYALFDAKPFLSKGRAVLLGAVCFGEGQKSTTTVQESNLLNPSTLIPEATLSIENLKTLPTKILENSKDPNNPGMVFVRGSIELTQHDTMAEYIEAAFLPESTIFTATLQRTNKGEIKGIKDVKSISLQTLAGDVTLCKLDKNCVERIREEFTPTPYKSPAIEQAEADCPTSQEIKKKLKNRQQVPKSLLDEAPNECEMVLNYYKITYSPNIDCVYAILKQDGQGKYLVQGILTFDTSTNPWKSQPLSFESQIRRAALDTAGLKSLPAKVYAEDFDGKKVAVRGSIVNSQASTMLEHIQWFVNRRVQEGFGNEDYKATGVRFGYAGPIRTVINLKPARR